MPEKNGGRAEVGFPPVAFALEALMELNRPALSAMAQVNGKVYANLAAINKSWADFLNRRLKEDLDVARQLAACKSVQEVYGFCAEYLQTAMSDYRSELEQISKLGKTLADDTLQAMKPQVDEAAPRSRPN